MIVTVKRRGTKAAHDAMEARYTLTTDALPGRTFGPFGFREMSNELMVFADMDRPTARDLILDAWSAGEASKGTTQQ